MRRARRTGGAAAAFLVGMAVLAGPANGADDDETQILPGATVNALALDLDGDGANEVVRLIDRDEPGMELEVVDIRNGVWAPTGSMEVASQPGPDGSLDPSSEIAALLRWRLDGKAHAMLATASMLAVPNLPPTVCCVELADVAIASHGVVLDPIETHDLRAEFVAAVDMDGDGTDELITSTTAYHDMNDTGVFRVEVHRWDGERFDRIYASERDGQGFGVIPGEADGRRGVELYLSPSPTGRIERLVLLDGAIHEEIGSVDLGGLSDGWVAGAANGRIIMQQPEGVRLVEWDRGGEPIVTSTMDSLAFPFINAVGEGEDAPFVLYDGFDFLGSPDPHLRILDRDLNEIRSLPMPERVRPLWDAARELSDTGYGIGRNILPYVGPLPTRGTRASWGFVANGVLVEPDGPAGFTLAEVSPLLGVAPIGLAARMTTGSSSARVQASGHSASPTRRSISFRTVQVSRSVHLGSCSRRRARRSRSPATRRRRSGPMMASRSRSTAARGSPHRMTSFTRSSMRRLAASSHSTTERCPTSSRSAISH